MKAKVFGINTGGNINGIAARVEKEVNEYLSQNSSLEIVDSDVMTTPSGVSLLVMFYKEEEMEEGGKKKK